MKKEKNFYKTSKIQRTTFKKLFFYIFVSLFFYSHSFADVLKPSVSIEPKEVVKIQLSALMKNDSPYKDRGILQTWEFAHPNNQRFTGPIEKFTNMLKTQAYSMLLNHQEHEISEIFKSQNLATYEVIILGKNKNYFKFKWQVEKNNFEGDRKDCWLTTAVSQPINLGSSI